MYKRFKTVTKIVSEFKKQIGEENFEHSYSELCEEPTIKFFTQSEMKLTSIKCELNEGIKKVEEIAVQTEDVGVVLPEEQMWLYKMFKLQTIKNLYVNQYVTFSPQGYSY